MSSVRGSIVAAVEARVVTIRTAAGYRTNLGLALRTWQAAPPDWTQLPVVQITDPESSAAAPAYGQVAHTISLGVEIMLPGGTAPSALRDYAADVLQAVGTDTTWGGLATTTRLTGVALDPGELQQVSAGVSVGLEVVYEAAAWVL